MRRKPFALTRSPFARNWSLLALSSLACQALGMLATVRAARTLSPDGYGQYNLVQTVATLGAIAAGLGARHVIIRACARYPEWSANLLYMSALARSAPLAIACAGILAYSHLGRLGSYQSLGTIAVGLVVGLVAWDLLESVAFGRERMGYSAGLNLVGSVVWSAGLWLVPAQWLTPLSVGVALATLQGSKALAYALLVGRLVCRDRGIGAASAAASPWPVLALTTTAAGSRSQTEPPGVVTLAGSESRAATLRHAGPATLRELLTQSLPFYWLALLTASVAQLPILLLAERSSPAEVGLYNVGFKLVYPLQVLINTALTALYPGLSRASVDDADRFVRTVHNALMGICVLGTAAALVVSLVREELVALLLGPEYGPAAAAMAFQSWYTVLLALYSLIGTVLAARDRQRWLAWLSTTYMALSIPLLWVGTGRGATGLAAALVIAAILNLGYHWVAFQRSLPVALPRRPVLQAASVVLVGMATAILAGGAPLVLRTGLGAVVLAALALWTLSAAGRLRRRWAEAP